MAGRELRIVDTSIVAGLQQGTAFFASTCLLAIGGCFALLGSIDDVARLYDDLSITTSLSPALWEAKLLGLASIFAYSFFKFGWAYRLFNYCSIIIGAVPSEAARDDPEMLDQIERAGKINSLGGRHFNAGLRGIFFGLGYMGWFLDSTIFLISTTLTVGVMIRRQYFSTTRKVLIEGRNVGE